MKRFLAVALALLAAGCATVPKLDAAADVHAFLVAVRDGDRAAFEAHVDRPALKTQLRSRVLAEGPAMVQADPNLGALGALLSGPLVDVAVDALVRPEVFRAVAVSHGYRPEQPLPNTLVIARALKALPGDRVCAPDAKGACQLVFANEGGVWRLVAYEGSVDTLRRGFGR